MIETITMALVASAPAVAAITGIVTAACKIISTGKNNNKQLFRKIDELEKRVLDTKEYETIKSELKIAHQENVQLKRQMNQLLTKLDRIDRGGPNETKRK